MAASAHETAPSLIAAGALKVYLRGLTSSDANVQRGALRALLAITLHAPPGGHEAGQRRPSKLGSVAQASSSSSAGPSPDVGTVLESVLESVLETVLGMAFLPGSAQALQLLTTLAAQNACAQRLSQPQKFDSVLALVRIQIEHGDFLAATHALRVVDAIMLHGAPPTPTPPPATTSSSHPRRSSKEQQGGGDDAWAALGARRRESSSAPPPPPPQFTAGVSAEQAVRIADIAERMLTIEGLDESCQAAAMHTAQQARSLHPSAFVGGEPESPVAVNGRSLPSEDEQQPMQRFSRWLQKSFNEIGSPSASSERVGEQVGGS